MQRIHTRARFCTAACRRAIDKSTEISAWHRPSNRARGRNKGVEHRLQLGAAGARESGRLAEVVGAWWAEESGQKGEGGMSRQCYSPHEQGCEGRAACFCAGAGAAPWSRPARPTAVVSSRLPDCGSLWTWPPLCCMARHRSQPPGPGSSPARCCRVGRGGAPCGQEWARPRARAAQARG